MKHILVFGDLHIPTRASSIPDVFRAHIECHHYDLALVTGDLVDEKQMRAVMPSLPKCFIVQGNMDMATHPYHHEVLIEDFHFLLLHGTQLRPRGNIEQLWLIANKLNANVTIHGHTHSPSIDLYKNRLFLNPGTITGATGGWGGRKDASFLELKVSSSQLIVTLIVTDWHTLKESTIEFRKTNDKISRV